MATYYRTPGIIISSYESKEADRIFLVFTELFGKLHLRAVSQRKITSKLRGGLMPYAVINLEFIEGKDQKTVTAADVDISYVNITKDLERIRIVFSIFRSIDALTRKDKEEKGIWNLIKDSLDLLNKETLDPKILNLIPYHFIWNLVSTTGYKPHLNSCVSCQIGVENRDVFFHALDGGIKCIKCTSHNGIKLSPETLRQLRSIINSRTLLLSKANMPIIETKAFHKASRDYLIHVLEQVS